MRLASTQANGIVVLSVAVAFIAAGCAGDGNLICDVLGVLGMAIAITLLLQGNPE